MEHWLPFFHDRLETMFDYLPDASVMLDDQVTPMRLARWEGIDDAYDARAEAMRAKGRMDTVYKPVAPGLLYLDDAGWEAAVAGHRRGAAVALGRRRRGRGCWMPAGGSAAVSRPSGSRKR